MLLNSNVNNLSSRNTNDSKQKWFQSELTQDCHSSKLPQKLPIGTQSKQKRGKDTFHRAGDWICNLCNNHNYSFREICNSCKTQTKIDNLKQSLNILGPTINPEIQKATIQKPIISKNKLKFKSQNNFELSNKSYVENQRPIFCAFRSVPELPQCWFGDAKISQPLKGIFEDSLNEFPFEKESIFQKQEFLKSEEEGDDSLEDTESCEIDRQTWKLLNFD